MFFKKILKKAMPRPPAELPAVPGPSRRSSQRAITMPETPLARLRDSDGNAPTSRVIGDAIARKETA